MAQYDDLNSRQIWVVGIVSAALTAITIFAVQVLYFALLDRHNEVKLRNSEYTISNGYLAEQNAELNSYGRDDETGAVRIPIQRAMELVVQRQAQQAEGGEDAQPTAETSGASPAPSNPSPKPASGDDEA